MKTEKKRLSLRKIWEKTRVFLPGALLALVFALGASLFPSQVTYRMREEPVSASSVPAKADREREEAERETAFRILREYDGRIGVFFPDGTLESVVEIDAYALPAYDRKLLSGGIVTGGEEELCELIESLRS